MILHKNITRILKFHYRNIPKYRNTGAILYNLKLVCNYSAKDSLNISLKDPSVQKYISVLKKEHKNLTENSDLIKNNRTQFVALSSIINILNEKEKVIENLNSLKELSSDKELSGLVNEEKITYENQITELDERLLESLLIDEVNDDCKALVFEISAGVGGKEAMLFAQELFQMYCNYMEFKKWKYAVVEIDATELSGLRHASIIIEGTDAYRQLKYEAGVHRVQRIPTTERSGRIHTSTISIAVLPQPDAVTINLKEKDLRIDTKRASGAGGQHVNTTDSAVRITHLPTGVSVECQTDRSQIKNREMAMKRLIAKLYQQQLDKQLSETKATRKSQKGSNFRNEKIRTYNFNQDRITDHRLGSNVHHLKEFLVGNSLLEDLIEKLHLMQKRERLLEAIENAKDVV